MTSLGPRMNGIKCLVLMDQSLWVLGFMDRIITVRYDQNSIMWGIIPDWAWYWPTKFFQWLILPKLIWIGKNVVIPIPIMVSLRQSAYRLALLLSWLEIISAFYEFQRRVGPLLKAGKDDALANAPTLKQVNEEMAKRKHGLFMEYDKFAPEYKFLYFYILFNKIGAYGPGLVFVSSDMDKIDSNKHTG